MIKLRWRSGDVEGLSLEIGCDAADRTSTVTC